MFDINQLRCFVAVAEEMHFGRAAERMHMSQPPFSRQIQILERILHVKLLERTSRSVKLTPAGQSFLPEARHILYRLDSAMQLAKRISLGKSGSLKVGFTPMAAFAILPRLVAAFRETFPQAELSLQESNSAEQLRKLHTSEIDIAILRPPLVETGLKYFCLETESLIAALPATHPLAAQATVKLKDFAGVPFIAYLPYEASYLCNLVGDLLARAGISPNYVQQLTHVHSIMALVHAGLGVSIVPEAVRLLNFSNVALRPIEDSQPKPVEFFMAWPINSMNPLLPQAVELARRVSAT